MYQCIYYTLHHAKTHLLTPRDNVTTVQSTRSTFHHRHFLCCVCFHCGGTSKGSRLNQEAPFLTFFRHLSFAIIKVTLPEAFPRRFLPWMRNFRQMAKNKQGPHHLGCISDLSLVLAVRQPQVRWRSNLRNSRLLCATSLNTGVSLKQHS